jgi:hypothetical protein
LGVQIKQDETGRVCGTYVEMRNIYRAFVGENLKERGYLEDPGIDWMVLKWILKKQDGRTWNEFIWFMIKKSGGLL